MDTALLADAVEARVGRRPAASFPVGGPCTVCGHTAERVVVFAEWREVWHRVPGLVCRLPNPPARKAVSS